MTESESKNEVRKKENMLLEDSKSKPQCQGGKRWFLVLTRGQLNDAGSARGYDQGDRLIELDGQT